MTPPERLAYIGDFSRDWNTEVHVAHGLREVGHDVVEMQEQAVDWRGLPARMRRERLGMLLWTHSRPGDHKAQRAALAALRDARVPSASYHLDRWFGLSRREHLVGVDPFFATDLVVTADGGHADRFQMAGVRHVWLPPGVHGPEVGRGTARPELAARVGFVGHRDYPHPEWRDERARLLAYLEDRYGDGFRVWPAARSAPVRGRDLNDVYASVDVVVGDSCLAGGASHYWSDRIPETLGRGGFLIHPHVDGLDDWYVDGEHLATFDLGNLNALGRLIDDWLGVPDSRRAVTDAALDLVAGRDTYTHRARELVAMASADPMRPGWFDGREGTVTAHRRGVRATFDLRPGSTDGTVVREVWQQDHYRLTADECRGGRVVVDVGAHVGSFTVLAAKLGARVVAVEPVPDNRARLEQHLAANRVAARVTVVGCALCDGVDEVPMSFDTSGSHIADDTADVVPAVSLPKLFADHGVEHAAVLKVDCEGCEYLNLAGLAEVLPRVNRAVFEFHGPRMPHLPHLTGGELGPLLVVLAEHGVVEVQGRPSTGGMVYWRRHR